MTTDIWQYIALTKEQVETLWKDVPLYKEAMSYSKDGFELSGNQQRGMAPGTVTPYYLRVKKEGTDSGD